MANAIKQISTSAVSSMDVMQFELATFCAASLPVAKKIAVTTLAACKMIHMILKIVKQRDNGYWIRKIKEEKPVNPLMKS